MLHLHVSAFSILLLRYFFSLHPREIFFFPRLPEGGGGEFLKQWACMEPPSGMCEVCIGFFASKETEISRARNKQNSA